jgi:hypothetical protein
LLALLLLLLLLLPDLKKVIGYPADQASQLLQVWKVRTAADACLERYATHTRSTHSKQCTPSGQHHHPACPSRM